jgi:hypothetical protein
MRGILPLRPALNTYPPPATLPIMPVRRQATLPTTFRYARPDPIDLLCTCTTYADADVKCIHCRLMEAFDPRTIQSRRASLPPSMKRRNFSTPNPLHGKMV